MAEARREEEDDLKDASVLRNRNQAAGKLWLLFLSQPSNTWLENYF